MGTDETMFWSQHGAGDCETEKVPPMTAPQEDMLAWSAETVPAETEAEDWDAAAASLGPDDSATPGRQPRETWVATIAGVSVIVILCGVVALLIGALHQHTDNTVATPLSAPAPPTWMRTPAPSAAPTPDPDVVPRPAPTAEPTTPPEAAPPNTPTPAPSFLPDQPPTTTNDYEFLDALRQHLTVYNPGRAITAAHYLCGAMRQGTTRANALTYIKTHGEFTNQGANDFLNTAITYYCPEESQP